MKRKANLRWKKALIGKKVKIQFHQHLFLGKIIDETRYTVILECEDGKTKRIIKNQCSISLLEEKIKIDGKVLRGRMEERLKNQRKKHW